MLDPLGARSGTFSHESVPTSRATATIAPNRAGASETNCRGNINLNNILRFMKSAGQLENHRVLYMPERGYAMVALLVAMGVMAVMMTAAMPVWKQLSQREKET